LTSCINEIDDEDCDENEILCNAVENSPNAPNYTAAMKPTAAGQWTTTIECELKSLRGNRTWVVVEKHLK
jgi:hypothetical protein